MMERDKDPAHSPEQHDASRLAEEAAGPQAGFLRELTAFLLENKKWWLAPVVIALLAVGLLIALGGTGAAPFVYTLF